MQIGCNNPAQNFNGYCEVCYPTTNLLIKKPDREIEEKTTTQSLAQKYSKYYKDVRHLSEIDVYAVHQLFYIQDPSGAIQHASKKLLLSGVRTGGKTAYDDIREARDTMSRWLQLNPETV